MRRLIDGYNVLFAQGLVGKRIGPDQFRQIRTRFLNKLTAALGPVESVLTTVVFDASASTTPPDLPPVSTHKGLTVLYAVKEESADERIERIIAEHPSPKSLTVVSSDQRIRRAAARRKARSITADVFLTEISTPLRKSKPAPPRADPEAVRGATLSESESAYWQKAFREVDEDPEVRQGLSQAEGIPTDEEIAEIEREVEREFRDGKYPAR